METVNGTQGESFTDGNGDGAYTADEYMDFNNNNQYDAGLTTVFKTAAKIEFQENPTGPSADFFFTLIIIQRGIVYLTPWYSKNLRRGY
jgi:hypothetical protein